MEEWMWKWKWNCGCHAALLTTFACSLRRMGRILNQNQNRSVASNNVRVAKGGNRVTGYGIYPTPICRPLTQSLIGIYGWHSAAAAAAIARNLAKFSISCVYLMSLNHLRFDAFDYPHSRGIHSRPVWRETPHYVIYDASMLRWVTLSVESFTRATQTRS